MSSFKINPLKGLQKNEICELVPVNNACFDICSAFSNSSNAWDINPECENECLKIVNDYRIKKYGVGWCDHHAPNRPVIWNRAIFPQYLNQTNNPEQALQLCYNDCEKTSTPLECKKRCKLHYDSIEYKENFKHSNNDNENNNNKNNNKKVLCCFLGIIITILIIFFVLSLINSKKRN